MKVLTEQRIRSSIQKFYSSIKNDENARYKSWEYCYKIFGEKQNKIAPETIDLLCLHLGFYLASWGMYRGSSFLLQKDYKVHKDAVLEMQKEKYNILYEIYLEEAPYFGLFRETDYIIYNQGLVGSLKPNVFNIFQNIEKWYRQ